MKSKKTLRLVAALVMLFAGIFNILFQFIGCKIYIYVASKGYLLFGILLVIYSVSNNKSKNDKSNNRQ